MQAVSKYRVLPPCFGPVFVEQGASGTFTQLVKRESVPMRTVHAYKWSCHRYEMIA